MRRLPDIARTLALVAGVLLLGTGSASAASHGAASPLATVRARTLLTSGASLRPPQAWRAAHPTPTPPPRVPASPLARGIATSIPTGLASSRADGRARSILAVLIAVPMTDPGAGAVRPLVPSQVVLAAAQAARFHHANAPPSARVVPALPA